MINHMITPSAEISWDSWELGSSEVRTYLLFPIVIHKRYVYQKLFYNITLQYITIMVFRVRKQMGWLV